MEREVIHNDQLTKNDTRNVTDRLNVFHCIPDNIEKDIKVPIKNIYKSIKYDDITS